ncbi:LCP family protein [Anaerosinus massiliensis]|uniref:LCP family protein n=1 Tax=Massilibacillus massiliensis TaxID=1806837 RepID=UPI000AC5A1D1|nr:LCP family protein [Massilibacillus massiliensis]
MKHDKNSKKIADKPKKRRRIRWGRVFIFVIILGSMLGTFAWASYSAYVVLKDVYTNCSVFLNDFQNKKAIQTKFQNEKFNHYTNILLLGIDDDSEQHADSIMIASINHADSSVKLLSIPRDTQVQIPGQKSLDMLSNSYTYGGTQLVLRTVEEFLQIPIHHFFVIDRNAFADMIDTIGGLDIYVESDMEYTDPYADSSAIHLKQGFQRLNGDAASQYMRYCSDDLGDIGRVQRQQRLFKTFYVEMARMDKITKIPAFVQIINHQVDTSMAMLDVVKIAKNMKYLDPDLIKVEMLPGQFVNKDKKSYWQPDQVAMDQILNSMFKDETAVLTTEENN